MHSRIKSIVGLRFTTSTPILRDHMIGSSFAHAKLTSGMQLVLQARFGQDWRVATGLLFQMLKREQGFDQQPPTCKIFPLLTVNASFWYSTRTG